MSIAGFIFKNAVRNRRRAALTIISVAVSLFLLVTLLVALRELTVPPEDAGAALRIAVRNKVSLANPLPARQRATIERIDGVEFVSPLTFFGGKFKDDEGVGFAQFALDPKLIQGIFSEAKTDPGDFDKFVHDRRGALLGSETAKRYGVNKGDRITLRGGIYPCDLELNIDGIYRGTIDDRNLYFHQEYFDEAMNNWGKVGTWWVKVRSPEDMPRVIGEINAAFANTSAEVRAETERSFQMSFISMLGNVTTFITLICTIVVFTLAVVTASTMSMAVRERFRELAILKALGFRTQELMLFILAESFGLAMMGALLGVGGAALLYTQVSGSKLTNGIFPFFEVTPQIVGTGVLVAAGLGIVAAIPPVFTISRTSVVQGLRMLD